MPQFFATYPLIASALTSVGAAAAGAGVSAALAPKMPKVNIPPPPGAAMISPAGQQAAANERRRAAAAGGMASTVTGANSSPTSGSKQLLGS